SHEIQTTTWAIILIAGSNISGTCLQAKTTVDTGKKLLFFVYERALQLRVGQWIHSASGTMRSEFCTVTVGFGLIGGTGRSPCLSSCRCSSIPLRAFTRQSSIE